MCSEATCDLVNKFIDTPYKGGQEAKIKTTNRTKGATNWKRQEN